MGCKKLTYKEENLTALRTVWALGNDAPNPIKAKNPEAIFGGVKADHLGNVHVTFSDRKLVDVDGSGNITGFRAEILSYSDYYVFGSIMPGRSYNETAYRYGAANGQEKVDEISGSGNHYTAEYWEYDPRTGRRWERDPVIKHHESPYAAFANNPIWFIDPNGADSTVYVYSPVDQETNKPAYDDKYLGNVKSEMEKVFQKNGLDFLKVEITTEQKVKEMGHLGEGSTDAALMITPWQGINSEGNSPVAESGNIYAPEPYLSTGNSYMDYKAMKAKGYKGSVFELIGTKAAHEVSHQYLERAKKMMAGVDIKNEYQGHNDYQTNLMMSGTQWSETVLKNPTSQNIQQWQNMKLVHRTLIQFYMQENK